VFIYPLRGRVLHTNREKLLSTRLASDTKALNSPGSLGEVSDNS